MAATVWKGYVSFVWCRFLCGLVRPRERRRYISKCSTPRHDTNVIVNHLSLREAIWTGHLIEIAERQRAAFGLHTLLCRHERIVSQEACPIKGEQNLALTLSPVSHLRHCQNSA
jgi:hypothetical protein